MKEKTKLEMTIDVFRESDIDLPTDVHNAIEDVFTETDSIENVEIYFKEDADIFEEDLTLENNVEIYLDKPSIGSSNNVFTFYGEVEYSLSEFVTIYDEKKNVLEEVTRIDNDHSTTINPEMFVVSLIEKVSWSDGNIIRTSTLYIYCPFMSVE